jgi:hypothetical protein
MRGSTPGHNLESSWAAPVPVYHTCFQPLWPSASQLRCYLLTERWRFTSNGVPLRGLGPHDFNSKPREWSFNAMDASQGVDWSSMVYDPIHGFAMPVAIYPV